MEEVKEWHFKEMYPCQVQAIKNNYYDVTAVAWEGNNKQQAVIN